MTSLKVYLVFEEADGTLSFGFDKAVLLRDKKRYFYISKRR